MNIGTSTSQVASSILLNLSVINSMAGDTWHFFIYTFSTIIGYFLGTNYPDHNPKTSTTGPGGGAAACRMSKVRIGPLDSCYVPLKTMPTLFTFDYFILHIYISDIRFRKQSQHLFKTCSAHQVAS